MWLFGDKWRFRLPCIVLSLFAAYVGFKLVKAHLVPEVDSITYDLEYDIDGQRGSILDAQGRPLADTITVWNYHLDPKALAERKVRCDRKSPPRTPEAIARTIASALKLPYAETLARVRDFNHRYQSLGKSSDRRAYDILSNSKLVAGVVIEDQQQREYPHHRSLCHVLGYVNAENTGSAGVEMLYNKWLTGEKGRVRSMKDAGGRELYDKRTVSIDAKRGADVYLTVDRNIQYETETALADGLREYGASTGWAIVMDARDAAVLAMASLPDFDPAKYGEASPEALMNRACCFTYEPGSVMKVITAAGAIDKGFVTIDSRYTSDRFDERYYKLPGDGHAMDPVMTIGEGIVHSSNVIIGKLSYDFGPSNLYPYMRKFGFGRKTGIEVPGEEVGILYDPKKHPWDKATWSRAGIGQSFTVTAIQLISAYQAIANDGVRMQPHLIKRIVAADGTELYRASERELSRPIRPATAKIMRNAMLGVAAPGGTARRAAIKGYSVAGKTGTAQKSGGKAGYIPGVYRATFCGMVPASDPRILVLVTLDFEHHTLYHQGGNSSGPVFRRIAKSALRYLMVPPDRPEEMLDEDGEDEIDAIMESRGE